MAAALPLPRRGAASTSTAREFYSPTGFNLIVTVEADLLHAHLDYLGAWSTALIACCAGRRLVSA